ALVARPQLLLREQGAPVPGAELDVDLLRRRRAVREEPAGELQEAALRGAFVGRRHVARSVAEVACAADLHAPSHVRGVRAAPSRPPPPLPPSPAGPSSAAPAPSDATSVASTAGRLARRWQSSASPTCSASADGKSADATAASGPSRRTVARCATDA